MFGGFRKKLYLCRQKTRGKERRQKSLFRPPLAPPNLGGELRQKSGRRRPGVVRRVGSNAMKNI